MLTTESNTIYVSSSSTPSTTTTTTSQKSSKKWQNIISGAAAGGASRMASAPLDIIKIRRQLHTTNSASLQSSLQSIAKSEGGVRGLFRGNVAAMYLWITYGVVQFSLYERTTQFIAKFKYKQTNKVVQQISSSSVATAFVAGGTAGIAATLTSYPFDTARTVFASRGLVSSSTAPRTLVDYTSRMVSTSGIRGLYAGVVPAMVQIVPYMGINFALYEFLVNKRDNKSTNAALAGFISGGTSKFIVYPLDTVKKRLQAQAFDASIKNYNGMVDCFVTIARKEGILAFYRGMVPTVFKSMISTGVAFGVYNFSKKILKEKDDFTKETKNS